MRNLTLLLFVFLSMHLFAQKEEVKPYISFLEKQSTSPVDYVFKLYEKYDIVVLGERDHRDVSQYELIKQIMSDPRFIEKVGHVFTEVGVYNQKENLNNVLMSNYSSYTAFEEALRKVYVNMDYNTLWEKYNYWIFLTDIYKINANQGSHHKVTIHPMDVSFNWEDCHTHEDWKAMMSTIDHGWRRDSIMGQNFVLDYEYLLQNKVGETAKALVILNSPHSYKGFRREQDGDVTSTTSYIISKYPTKVANVMLNYIRSREKGRDRLIAQGKWDAAFKYIENKPLGFDFADSPFGADYFDIYGVVPSSLQYKDVFTGFVFYKPIFDWELSIGIPGIVTKEFLPELNRRAKIIRPEYDMKDEENEVQYYNRLRTFPVYGSEGDPFSRDSINSDIDYWLR